MVGTGKLKIKAHRCAQLRLYLYLIDKRLCISMI